ncbi:MAG: hypothetical protein QOJ03_1451 [Frankiaceae bacterium]|jgi:AcrR family transcriptional regulator|nr:hypothetical protein [Frankiaceae bacterium]
MRSSGGTSSAKSRPATGQPAKSQGVVVQLPANTPGTRELILATAQRLFDEQGYAATSLRQIADAVGMTKAAVYYHYPAKEHLLLELARPMLDDMGDMIARLRSREGTVPDPIEALEAYLDLFVEHLSVVGLMARDPATQNHPDVGRRLRTLVEAIQLQIAGPEASAEHSIRTSCAMGVIHAVSMLSPEAAAAHRSVILDAAVAALGVRR